MKIRGLIIHVTCLIAMGCANKEEIKTSSTSPAQTNIIYILADDLGYGDLGCYGQEIIKTPNIDKLAAEGMRFTDHYAGAPVCGPSRCVLMTGLHTGHAVKRGNLINEFPLPDTVVTVAELLKEAGYKTGMIGKWGLGDAGTSGSPMKQGWDYFLGYNDQVLAHNYWPEFLIENEDTIYLENEVNYLDTTLWHKGLGSYSTVKKEYSNDLFTDAAVKFINENQANPFFLYLPYTLPHENGEAPVGQKMEVPDYGSYAAKDWASDTIGYAAMIERLDNYVGTIITKVDELGLAENTLIIFTSDNGPINEEKFGLTRFFDSNGALRGSKRDLYEGGIRVPMIARWKGNIEPNTETNLLSSFTDFLATACDVAGIETPKNTDGISFLPTLRGESQEGHEHIYFEFHHAWQKEKNLQSVRKGKWKAVRSDFFENPDKQWELYNLSGDLSETKNIANQHPEKMKELAEIAKKEHRFDPKWMLFEQETKVETE